ncbi:hypothetical protein [Streptomyces bottropensis]|uniref:hypothetical protein n=1 Tax=Streptomyces bottropensis TaxID=42235 RepID=UPI003676B7E7
MLGVLEERARASVHGWVLDVDVLPMRQSVRALADRGLVEIASREHRAELSAWEGTAVLWAARVAPAGHDLLLYARLRPCPEAAPEEPGPEHLLVELRPSQMAALRLFVGLAGQLRVPLAEGLVEQVRTARCDGDQAVAAVSDGGPARRYGVGVRRLGPRVLVQVQDRADEHMP